MEIVAVEICYKGGPVVTDRVVLNRESAQVTLPPRLSKVLAILDQSGHRQSFVAECGGVQFPVECDAERGYFVDFNQGSRSKHAFGVKYVFSPTAEQRKLNGRFAHMLSAGALIGACFLIETASALNGKSLLEPIVLCLLSVALFIVGQRCCR